MILEHNFYGLPVYYWAVAVVAVVVVLGYLQTRRSRKLLVERLTAQLPLATTYADVLEIYEAAPSGSAIELAARDKLLSLIRQALSFVTSYPACRSLVESIPEIDEATELLETAVYATYSLADATSEHMLDLYAVVQEGFWGNDHDLLRKIADQALERAETIEDCDEIQETVSEGHLDLDDIRLRQINLTTDPEECLRLASFEIEEGVLEYDVPREAVLRAADLIRAAA